MVAEIKGSHHKEKEEERHQRGTNTGEGQKGDSYKERTPYGGKI